MTGLIRANRERGQMFDQSTLVRVIYNALQDAAPKLGVSGRSNVICPFIRETLTDSHPGGIVPDICSMDRPTCANNSAERGSSE
jgi:hypothetical protein